MITIYAEKPDVGNKIAAALDKITLASGKEVTFEQLKANEKAVKAQQHKDGYLKINFMNEDCYITWGYGHLFELKQAYDYDSDYKNWNNLPIPFFPENWDIKPYPDKKTQINIVKSLIKKSDLVINATDDDREGDLIFWYLCEGINYNKDFKRAIFSSQTKNAFQNAFQMSNLLSKKDVLPRTMAGMSRSAGDAAVGWNITSLMTIKLSSGKGDILSYGRVQTPVQNLIVEREMEIKNFKPVTYYKIDGEFTTSKGESYKGTCTQPVKTKEDAKKIIDLLSGNDGIITDIKEENGYKQNPELYSLSALQMAANKRFGFTLDETLDIAQDLYEKGLTTYPRTDSRFLTEDMEPTIISVLNKIKSQPDYNTLIPNSPVIINKTKYFNSSKVNSHFAIIPTGNNPSGLNDKQQKIYDLIARSVIIMIYPPAQLLRSTITTTTKEVPFRTIGLAIKDQGWMVVDSSAKEHLIPKLSKGEKVIGNYNSQEKQTEPPKRYTDETILAAMKTVGKTVTDKELKTILSDPSVQGIGTEATRASILQTLVDRKYIERKNKTIFPTDKGIQIIQTLPIDELKSAELTAVWEKKMTNIEKGIYSYDLFIDEIQKKVREWTSEINSKIAKTQTNTKPNPNFQDTGLKCPICGKEIIKYKWGWGCSGYTTGCKFSLSNEIYGKKMSVGILKELVEKKETSKIKGFVSNKNGKKKEYEAALELDSTGKIKLKFNKS